MKKKKYNHLQRGQIGLWILLISVIVLTIGIATLSRTTEETEITREQEQEDRTFAAADTAAERAYSEIKTSPNLGNIKKNESIDLEGIKAEYEITPQTEIDTTIKEGNVIEVKAADDAPVTIEWAKNDDACDDGGNPASLVISYYHIDGNNVTPQHFAYGDLTCSSSRSDDFENANRNGNKLELNINDSLLDGSMKVKKGDIIRVRSVYNDTDIKISGAETAQYTIKAFAESQESEAASAVQIEVIEKGAPGVLDFALVSGTDITQ